MMDRIQKRLLSFALTAALALTLTACGGGVADSGMTNSGGNSIVDESWDGGGNGVIFDSALPEEAETNMASGSSGAALLQYQAPEGAKIIYTASIRSETTDFDTASQALSHIVDEFSGYFETRSVTNYDIRRSGYYTIRVPAAQFEAFCEQVGKICHVTDLETGQQDVSETYYDIEARLTTQQTKLARLQTLLSQAENMTDIITIESAISDTELEIEYLTGNLRHYDAQIGYSTVKLSLDEVYQLSNQQEPPQTFGGQLAQAFTQGWEGFLSCLQALATAVAFLWVPLLVLIPLAAYLLIRRRKKRQAAAQSEYVEKK